MIFSQGGRAKEKYFCLMLCSKKGCCAMICATASGSYGLFYAFKEADKTGAACFVQLVHTGIGQHLCEHMAYLVLQD